MRPESRQVLASPPAPLRLKLVPGGAGLLVLTAGCTPILGVPGSNSDPPSCPRYQQPEAIATVDEPALDEVSGIVASREHDDIFWVHNDSGDIARFFAIDTRGEVRGVYQLQGVTARDWEDLAIGPGPDGSPWLYLGDIGDNDEVRTGIVVHALPEPDTLSGTITDPTLVTAESYPLTYPDGVFDAETLLLEPDRSLVIITKSRIGQSGVYRARPPHLTDELRTLERVAEIVLGIEPIPGDRRATGGDLTPDGTLFALRTNQHVWLWPLAPDEPLESALLRPPCLAPSPAEPQGEALGFDVDPPTFWTLSEGIGQPLYRVAVAQD